LEADRIALQRSKKKRLKKIVKNLFVPDYIWKFQKSLRKAEYYRNCKKDIFSKIYIPFIYRKFAKLSLKLGFSIPYNVIGPGLAIVHYGTIVISPYAKIGSNFRIHACTNIGMANGKAPIIGDNCYVGPGAKLYGEITLGNNIVVGANSVVNKSFIQDNIAIAGVPAKEIGINKYQLIIEATDFLNQGITDISRIRKILVERNPYLRNIDDNN
jgi:serine O-acetyltransferase